MAEVDGAVYGLTKAYVEFGGGGAAAEEGRLSGRCLDESVLEAEPAAHGDAAHGEPAACGEAVAEVELGADVYAVGTQGGPPVLGSERRLLEEGATTHLRVAQVDGAFGDEPAPAVQVPSYVQPVGLERRPRRVAQLGAFEDDAAAYGGVPQIGAAVDAESRTGLDVSADGGAQQLQRAFATAVAVPGQVAVLQVQGAADRGAVQIHRPSHPAPGDLALPPDRDADRGEAGQHAVAQLQGAQGSAVEGQRGLARNGSCAAAGFPRRPPRPGRAAR